ncbi:hypothetical protein CEP54_015762 [Fusarium duplospermum]|uniref:Uncharacterized protein n=1 Tax=Fusarium duplospermum TaxID=1325734 RepID=A0A428NLG5_9HYPO|nr:hypothetical protein CEP54_015762 [Fusarium duplospermum]
MTVIDLHKERMGLKGRRTRSRRQIKGVKDDAFTIGEYRKIAKAREQEEQRLAQKRLSRQQNADFDKLCDSGKPCLRGGAAVKAKREKAAAEALALASQDANRQRIIDETEKDILENRRRIFIGADKEKRDFQYRIWGHDVLEAIPEAAGFLANLDKAAPLRGRHDDIPDDFFSVSSGSSTPLLPGNEDSDDDEVDITISTQIEGYKQAAFAAGRGGYSEENSDAEEDLSRREDWGGFGYDRVLNNYSDDEKVEPCIVVAGIPIPVPQSRARD